MKINWSAIVQSVLGVLLAASLMALFTMHTGLVALKAQIDERQRTAIRASEVADIKARLNSLEKEQEQQREWLKTLSNRVNSR